MTCPFTGIGVILKFYFGFAQGWDLPFYVLLLIYERISSGPEVPRF